MQQAERLFNIWLGLASLAVILYWVFSEPSDTVAIINQAGTTTGEFISTLQGG